MSVHTDPTLLPEEMLAPSPRSQMIKRALGHKGLLLGAFIVGTLILIALFAPLLAPHDPYVQSLAKRLLPPAWEAG